MGDIMEIDDPIGSVFSQSTRKRRRSLYESPSALPGAESTSEEQETRLKLVRTGQQTPVYNFINPTPTTSPTWVAANTTDPYGQALTWTGPLSSWESQDSMIGNSLICALPVQRKLLELSLEVKLLSGKRLTVTMDSRSSVNSLKSFVYSQTSIPVPAQRLIFHGRHLADDHSLDYYNLKTGDIVHLVFAR